MLAGFHLRVPRAHLVVGARGAAGGGRRDAGGGADRRPRAVGEFGRRLARARAR